MAKYTVKKTTDKPEKRARVVEIEIPTDEVDNFEKKAVKSLSEKADIQGFRKGHIPSQVIVEKIGKAGILEETINLWLKENIKEFIEKEAPDALIMPQVSVTKAVPGNPVELSFLISLRPDLKIPDYKKISADKNKKRETPAEVTDKELDEAILRLRKYAVRAINPTIQTEPKDEELPPLNDQFAEAVGGGKTVAELKERIKKDLENENKNRLREKRRLAILEGILEKTEGAIPDVLIDYEIERMETELESDVQRMGLKMEDYLKNAKKTHEDLHKEWRAPAEKRAKINLILAEIKKLEKLEAEKEKIEHELKHLAEHHKDIDQEQARAYIERMLGNEKVFEFLENL